MTNLKDVTAQSGNNPTWQIANFIPVLLVSVFLLMVYLALLGADSQQPAQTATTVARGQAIGYSMAAAAENGLTEADLGQPYLDWLQAAHANAARNDRDEPPPVQF